MLDKLNLFSEICVLDCVSLAVRLLSDLDAFSEDVALRSFFVQLLADFDELRKYVELDNNVSLKIVRFA